MFQAIVTFLAASPYGITAQSIGIPASTTNVGVAIANIVQLLMSLIGMLAVVFIIYAALQMGLSAGNASRFAKAREQLLYAVVGLAVAIGAYAIVTFILTYTK